jgi:hypothetical protein
MLCIKHFIKDYPCFILTNKIGYHICSVETKEPGKLFIFASNYGFVFEVFEGSSLKMTCSNLKWNTFRKIVHSWLMELVSFNIVNNLVKCILLNCHKHCVFALQVGKITNVIGRVKFYTFLFVTIRNDWDLLLGNDWNIKRFLRVKTKEPQ